MPPRWPRNGVAMTISQQIRAEVEKQNLTQKELATRLGISTAYTNDILRGRRAVSAFVAIRLESVLGMDAGRILHDQVNEDLAQARKELRA